MNELQKKILVHLLNELYEHVRHETCDESEVSSLSAGERKTLTRMLYEQWDELDEWDGRANREFGTSSLCHLALSWLGVPYPYAREDG